MDKKSVYLLFIFTLLLALAAAGCSTSNSPGTNNNQDNTGPETEKQEVVLYFADEQAEYLVPEKRIILKEEQLEAEAVVKALIEGPQDKKLGITVPAGTKLLSVEVQDKIARVDFSEEIRSKHWGGSTGESMTVFSIVNSLTELDGIDKVQILINGQKQDSLVGHLDISQPLTRNVEIVKP